MTKPQSVDFGDEFVPAGPLHAGYKVVVTGPFENDTWPVAVLYDSGERGSDRLFSLANPAKWRKLEPSSVQSKPTDFDLFIEEGCTVDFSEHLFRAEEDASADD